MNDPASGCPFCNIAAGHAPAAVVLRTEEVVAFFPDEPATPGHTLIIPREHVDNIWDVNSGQARHLTDATLRVAHAVRDTLSPDGLNVIQSNGEAATQSIFHLHIHVLPRYADDAIGPIWPRTGWKNREQIDQAYERLRSRLADEQ